MVFWRTMVPLVSFLAALRILTEAQSCNNGVGKLVYEKVSDYKLGGSATFNTARQRNEVVTRMDVPIKVLQECVRRCQEDRTTAIQQCLSFDFVPGRRRTFPSPAPNSLTAPGPSAPSPGSNVQYDESSCYFYFDRASPDGADTLIRQNNAWHYNEVCLTSTKVSTDCPTRLYVFERTPGYKFEGDTDKEVFASNRTECEDKCLNEYEFICRSATFDRAGQRCRLSRMTKSMKPEALRTDPNSDYMENMCMSSSQLCTTTAFILESGKELDGAFEREVISVRDFQECSTLCTHSLDDKGFLCRSFLYDDKSRTCVIYDEDPLGITEGPDTQRPLKTSSGDLYRVICGTSDRDALINNATFECYRRKRLDWSHQVEVKSYSFQECLDECMKRYGRECRSVEYSSRYQSCRFSSSDGYGKSRPNLIDDDSYDYYEFKWYRGGGTYGGGYTGGWPNQGGTGSGLGGLGGGSGIGGPLPPPGPSGPLPGPPYGSGNPTFSGWRGGGSGSGYGGFGQGYGNGIIPSAGPGVGSHVNYGGGYGGGPGGYGGYGGGYGGFGSGSGGAGYGIPYGGGYNSQNMPPYPPKDQFPYPPGFPMDKCKPGPNGMGGGTFKKVGFGVRLRPFYVRRVVRTERLEECERSCLEAVDLVCRSFNFKTFVSDNCELSDYDTRQLQIANPSHFEQNTQFDYYEKDGNGISSRVGPDCLDVSQTCSPDGMEFTLKTPEGFFGRVYTYGFYDSCFFDGNGGTTNVLRISRANGFPRCGTQQYGDVITNIVVVQFNDFVQTSRDKKYNLTCYFSGPGEAVVTSNYLDTRTDGRYPTQIEHLPAQNILTSNVVLRVLYRGTPTNTIAVGDLLTFRLEARGHYRFEFFSDIFATNVIAKDPYSGRQVHLIDSRGCPVDLYVFPELHRTPDGALEAEFYAFKIPDSNLLVFQATVRSCRGPCEPVICNDRGRPGTFPSWGRRKRAVNGTRTTSAGASSKRNSTRKNAGSVTQNATAEEEEEEVHELMQVYLSRSDMPAESPAAVYKTPTVCVAQAGYYALVVIVAVLVCVMLAFGLAISLYIRRIKREMKTAEASSTSPSTTNLYVSQFQPPRFEDPSEPIYTDPSLFERSRSMRSLTVGNMGKIKSIDYE